ncbi:hypothetical protein OAU43_00175 [Gammaproteobacteria bacterium]|nr:hypothetical protein [Gammaproteobacteria bacterium]
MKSFFAKLKHIIDGLVNNDKLEKIDRIGEDLSLLDLTSLILIYKKIYYFLIPIFIVVSVFIALSIPRYYESSVLMVSNTNSASNGSLGSLIGGVFGSSSSNLDISSSKPSKETAIAILQSKRFIESYIDENNLMPVIFSGLDMKKEDKEFDLSDGYEAIGSALEIYYDSGPLIQMTVTWSEPAFAAQLANGMIQTVNEFIRQEAILESRKSISFLEEQLGSKDANTNQILSKLIETQMQSMVLASVREQYMFKVIDPAVQPKNPSGPSRRLIVLVAALMGFTLSFIISIIHFQARKP